MGTRFKIRRLLRSILRLHAEPHQPVQAATSEFNWLAFVEEANRERLAPALATALRSRAGVLPADVEDYLELLLSANAARNQRIRAQCLAIGSTLKQHGITAVVLKGATWLFGDNHDAAADRMMTDIDLALPASQVQDGATILKAAGYFEYPNFTEPDHHHLPPLISERGEAAVEIHIDLSRWPSFLPIAELVAEEIEVAPGLALPSTAHRLIHNVIHTQIDGAHFAGGVVSLRESLDISRIVSGDPAIDWRAVRAVAVQRGYLAPLSGALHVAAGALAMPLPQEFVRDWSGRTQGLRGRIYERWPIIGETSRDLVLLSRGLSYERDAYGLRRHGYSGSRLLTAVMRRRIARIGRWLRSSSIGH